MTYAHVHVRRLSIPGVMIIMLTHYLDLASFLLNEFRSFALLSATIPIFMIVLYVLSVVKERRSLIQMNSKVSTV